MTVAFIEVASTELATSWPSGAEWQHEVKFDGWRVQVHVCDGKAKFYSRNGNELTRRFSKVAKLVAPIAAKHCIIDGELVATDEQGRCDFLALHKGLKHRLVIRAFDLLWIDGSDLRMMPLIVRRMRLRKLIADSQVECLLFSDHFDDPSKLFAAVEAMGLEGIVSKRKGDPYFAGERSGWRKIKTKAWTTSNSERGKLFEIA